MGGWLLFMANQGGGVGSTPATANVWRIFRMHVAPEVLVPQPVSLTILVRQPAQREVIVGMTAGG